MLKIKPVDVEAINKMYQNPKKRLYEITLAFLRQAEPPPMWRAIIKALKSTTVNLTALAKKVEAAHTLASCDLPNTFGESNRHSLNYEVLTACDFIDTSSA